MITDPPQIQLAFEIKVSCGPPQTLGPTPAGLAQMVPILGGAVSGPKLSGEILPGGADWPIVRNDGVILVKAHYAIKTDDGALIEVNNQGMAELRKGDPMPVLHARTVVSFNAPDGPHGWLNKQMFVGSIGLDPVIPGDVIVRIFELI